MAIPPQIQMPNAGDRVVNDVAALRSALQAAGFSSVSLHLVGNFVLGDTGPVVITSATTLWAEEGEATIDAEERSRVLEVQNSQLLLRNIIVTRGRSAGDAGGCIYAGSSPLSWLGVHGGRVSQCFSGFQFGGGVAQLNGVVQLRDTLLEDCEVRYFGSNSNSMGGGLSVFVGHVLIVNTSFIRCSVVTGTSGTVYGGAVGLRDAGTISMRDVSFRSCCVQSDSGDTTGGALALHGGSVDADGLSFEECSVSSGQAISIGGGVGIFAGGMIARHLSFADTLASSGTGDFVSGGGIGLRGGQLNLTDASFERTRASSGTARAFGGGVGMLSGRVDALRTSFVEASVASNSTLPNAAFGGAIGMNDGTMIFTHARLVRSRVQALNSNGEGGSVGINDGSLALRNASLIDSYTASSPSPPAPWALVLHAPRPAQLIATLLHVVQTCSAAEATLPLVWSGNDGNEMLLRDASFDAASCTVPIGGSVALASCDAASSAPWMPSERLWAWGRLRALEYGPFHTRLRLHGQHLPVAGSGFDRSCSFC